MKIFIPTIKTQIKLTRDWQFSLYHEYRNDSLWEAYSGNKFHYNNNQPYDDYLRNPPAPLQVTLNKDCVIMVDRIYIKKNYQEFDSVSFIITEGFKPVKEGTEIQTFGSGRKHRFWAKLEDVNNIEGDILVKPAVLEKHHYMGWYEQNYNGHIYRNVSYRCILKEKNDDKAILQLAKKMKGRNDLTIYEVRKYRDSKKLAYDVIWKKP